jgi:hypothetical protein
MAATGWKACSFVTLQARVGGRNGFRSGVNTGRCPGLGARALRLES